MILSFLSAISNLDFIKSKNFNSVFFEHELDCIIDRSFRRIVLINSYVIGDESSTNGCLTLIVTKLGNDFELHDFPTSSLLSIISSTSTCLIPAQICDNRLI
jgi:hypothetical protein